MLDVPLGHTAGPANDAATQRSILIETLQSAIAMTTPSQVTLDYRWIDDDWKAEPLSWSRQRQSATSEGIDNTSLSGGGDTRTPRSDRPAYKSQADEEAALSRPFTDQCLVCVGLPEPA